MNNEKLNIAKDHIEGAKKDIAKALNLIEAANMKFGWAVDLAKEGGENWSDELEFTFDKGASIIGFVLATLVNWYDEDDDDVKETTNV